MLARLSRFISLPALPLLSDLRARRPGDFGADALAGTVTAILIIPQAIAYALLAGLPPLMGLSAAIVAPLAYAFLGSSRSVIIGPAAVQAAMVGAALAGFGAGAVPGALLIGLISGALLVALGLLRFGWLTNFISNPVLTGFTTGAVIYIVITQTAGLLGFSVAQGLSAVQALGVIYRRIDETNAGAAVCGIAAIGLLLAARRWGPGLAARLGLGAAIGGQLGRVSPLAVVAGFALLSSFMHLSQGFGVPVVGTIPGSLPHLQAPSLAALDWRALLPASVLIALVGYIETLSVAKALAFKRRQRIDPDRELLALGITNIATSFTGGMPVAGSFSKSVVNYEAGAATQLSGIIASAFVAVCLVFFTAFLHELPRSVLSAIIIVAVSRLIDLASLKKTWAYDRGDGFAQAATIAGVLGLGIEPGLMLGSAVAIALFLYKTSRPRILIVGNVPGTEHFRSVHRNDVVTYEHLLMIRIDENLYFANTPRVETELQRFVAEHPLATDVVIILSGIGYIDASSLDMLDNFETELAATGTRLHLAELKSQVIDRLEGTELFARLGPLRVHRSAFDVLRSFDSGLI